MKLHLFLRSIKTIWLLVNVMMTLSISVITAQNKPNDVIFPLKVLKKPYLVDDFSKHDYFLIESDYPLNASKISAMGLFLHRKLSSKSTVVSIYDKQRFLLHPDKSEYQYYAIHKEWKLASNLNSANEKELIRVWASILDESKFEQFLSANKMIDVLLHRQQFYQLALPAHMVSDLTNQSFVTHISLAETSAIANATVLDLNLHPNRINALHHFYPELNGKDHIISIKEPFYEVTDIDIRGRYLNSGLESNLIASHPLQMATILVGQGNSFGTGKGVAIEAFHTSRDRKSVR